MSQPSSPVALCPRCHCPQATRTDAEAVSARAIPDGWPDREGSHLCWRAVAGGVCESVEPAEEEVLRLRERVAALEAARDEARATVDRLRAERDALEARVEAVGVTLATDAQEVITARTRERDEARAQLAAIEPHLDAGREYLVRLRDWQPIGPPEEVPTTLAERARLMAVELATEAEEAGRARAQLAEAIGAMNRIGAALEPTGVFAVSDSYHECVAVLAAQLAEALAARDAAQSAHLRDAEAWRDQAADMRERIDRLYDERDEFAAEIAAFQGRPEGGLPGWRIAEDGVWQRGSWHATDVGVCRVESPGFAGTFRWNAYGPQPEPRGRGFGEAPSPRAAMRAAEAEATRRGWLPEGGGER
jgi:hypothetical protein